MPSFLEQSRHAQEEKRRAEKDPADLSGAQEPDWDNPATWGGSGSGASDSASGNADDSSSGTGRKDPDPPKPAASFSGPAVTTAGSRRPPRRRGRPRGPERVALTVRILTSTDRKLTAAVEQTGLNPQTIVEQAMEAYFRRLKVEDPGPEQKSDVA